MGPWVMCTHAYCIYVSPSLAREVDGELHSFIHSCHGEQQV